MLTVKKVETQDFENIIELLEMFNNKDVDRMQWKRLFMPICKKLNNDFFGFALIDDNRYVGYIAGIQSERVINGKLQKFCNVSSWIIHPEYRNKKIGFMLFQALMTLENFNFYVLSPVKHTYKYYINDYGFKENTSKANTLLPFTFLNLCSNNSSLLINDSSIRNFLNENDKNIYDDHQLPEIFHILYRYKEQNIYCVIKPTPYSSYVLNTSLLISVFTKLWFKLFRKDFFSPKIKLGLVHYTNNPLLFSESISKYNKKICSHLKVIGLSINDRYLPKRPKFCFKNNINCSGLYKSEELSQDDFDTLYSELTLLNLSHFQL